MDLKDLIPMIATNGTAVIAFIFFVLWGQRNTKTFFKEMSSKVDKLLAMSGKIDYIDENYDLFKSFIENTHGDGRKIYMKIKKETDILMDKLDENFSNGSSKQIAMNDLSSFRRNVDEYLLADSGLIPNEKNLLSVLIDQVEDCFNELIVSLDLLKNYVVKGKLIPAYSQAMQELINYFFTHWRMYETISIEEVKTDITRRWKSLYRKRKDLIEIPENPIV